METQGDSQVALVVKNSPAKAGDVRDEGSVSGLGRSPGRGHGNSAVFLAGESHGHRTLMGCSPWGPKESDTAEVTQHACSADTGVENGLVDTVWEGVVVVQLLGRV